MAVIFYHNKDNVIPLISGILLGVTKKRAIVYFGFMNNRKKGKKKEMLPDDKLKQLGERIRELRKAAGYTSLEIFAYENGFGKTQYGRYENGEDLRFSTLIRVINCFGIDLKEFFSEGFE